MFVGLLLLRLSARVRTLSRSRTMTDVVDEEAWLLASPQKPRRRGARVVVAGVLARAARS